MNFIFIWCLLLEETIQNLDHCFKCVPKDTLSLSHCLKNKQHHSLLSICWCCCLFFVLHIWKITLILYFKFFLCPISHIPWCPRKPFNFPCCFLLLLFFCYIMQSIRKVWILCNDVLVSLVLTAEGVFVDRTLRGPNNGMLSPAYTAQHSTDWG